MRSGAINGIGIGKETEYLEKSCTTAILPTMYPTITELRLYQGNHGEMLDLLDL